MALEEKFDLVILGSGSTAFAAALRAQEMGKTAVMTEERVVGGTCVNRGCLPSKNLIEAAQLVYYAAHPRYPGLGPAAIDIDFPSLVRQKDQIVAGYRQKKYESLLGGKFRVEHGHAQFIHDHGVEVNGKRLIGETILIATGSRPRLPDIRGLSEVPFLTSDLLAMGEESELTELPTSMLIIGGGYVAHELAQMFHRFGTAVTIVERASELFSDGYEPEVGPAIRKLLVEDGIEVLTGATVPEVRAERGEIAATLAVNGARHELRAQRLVIATGRLPNTERIGLDRTGVTLGHQGQVVVDEYLRTRAPHIFAAGDVIGREHGSQMATPVGSQDGGTVAHNAFSGGPLRKANHRVVPRAVFIDPPLATVGMTEQEALTAGHRCWSGVVPMSLVPKAAAIRDTRGFVKMVADYETSEVLGVTMLGHSASEVIHEAAMALRFRAKLQDFIDLLHVYPTMSEALKIAALARFKDPAKLSCCAE
jgi:mercuric reductase